MRISKRIEAVLKQLPSDWAEFSPSSLAKWIEEFHSQEVQLVPFPLSPGLFGCCLIVIDRDEPPSAMVIYNSELPPAHQLHVQMHELAHLALGHPTWTGTSEELAAHLKDPTRLGELIEQFSCRRLTYHQKGQATTVEDQEAELLTRILIERKFAARQAGQLRRGSSHADLDEALRRMGIAK